MEYDIWKKKPLTRVSVLIDCETWEILCNLATIEGYQGRTTPFGFMSHWHKKPKKFTACGYVSELGDLSGNGQLFLTMRKKCWKMKPKKKTLMGKAKED